MYLMNKSCSVWLLNLRLLGNFEYLCLKMVIDQSSNPQGQVGGMLDLLPRLKADAMVCTTIQSSSTFNLLFHWYPAFSVYNYCFTLTVCTLLRMILAES